jgi:hypothetical protein
VSRMRTAVALVTVAAALLAAVPAQALRVGQCRLGKGAAISVASKRAVIFRRKDRRGLFVAYACHLRVGRNFRLSNHDDPNGDTTVVPKALTGRYAGYAVTHCPGPGGEDCISRVFVRDTRNGKTLRSARAYVGATNDFFTDSLVLAPNGDVAWIAESDDPSEAFEVRAATAGGTTQLDAGPEVDPDSLALAGRRVYWTVGGEPRSAVLP